MNSLNSVLIEGTYVDFVRGKNLDGQLALLFEIDSHRKTQLSPTEVHEETSRFEIQTFGKIAELCKSITPGTFVRVVGHLKQQSYITPEGNEAQRVVIVAEHIECKPVKQGATA